MDQRIVSECIFFTALILFVVVAGRTIVFLFVVVGRVAFADCHHARSFDKIIVRLC